MKKKNTKELILLKALELFADKGYDGVTVRNIAAEVGIKQSSLYKHYRSKKEIFVTLIEKMQEKFKNDLAAFHLPEGEMNEIARKYGNSGSDFLKEISKKIFLYYLKNPYALQFRRLLSIERFKDKKIDIRYRELYIDSVIAYQTNIFSELMKQGYIRQGDPMIIALQFFSPIFVLLNQYDCIPEKENEALKILEKHIEQFNVSWRND